MTDDEFYSVEEFVKKLEADERAVDMKCSLYRMPQWMLAKEVNQNNNSYERNYGI